MFVRESGGDRKRTDFYNEQQSPIRDGYLEMLNSIGEQATKCTSNSGKAKPRSDSGAIFGFGIIECLGKMMSARNLQKIRRQTKI
jgi:hypothetical protein